MIYIRKHSAKSTAGVALWIVWTAIVPTISVAQSNPASPPGSNSAPTRTEADKPPSALIMIPDEPKTIDPASVLPIQLTANVTVEFKEQPLKEIVKWLQTERSLNVVVDYLALENDGFLLGEPVTDRSNDAPLYLLLNRLKSLNLSWYFEDEILYITSITDAEFHMSTIPYNVGDLLDAGFKSHALGQTLTTRGGGKWSQIDGEGAALIQLGDVIFVRATFEQHQAVAALLAALRKHGRRTLILDPVQHEILRQKLNEKITVDFDERPLYEVIAEISKQVSADIRLDSLALADDGVSELVPISLKVTNQPLDMVLKSRLMSSRLTRIVRDGVLWITTQTAAESKWEVAVFDVRDLCRDQSESVQLMQAIRMQTGGKWEMVDGEGGTLISPLPGVLVAQQNQQMLDDVLKLLANYRQALLASKPRKNDETDPTELSTRYYRMQKQIAEDLFALLPTLVAPASWKTIARPEGLGTVHLVSSSTRLIRANGREIISDSNSSESKNQMAIPMSHSVLIIHQTRENHDAIAKMLDKIENGEFHGHGGNKFQGGGMGGGGMGRESGGAGMGGGGFGGGFFSNPSK